MTIPIRRSTSSSEKFEEVTGDPPPTSTALTGYSVIQAVQKGIEENGGSTDGAALAKTIEGFKDEPLLVGPTTFTPQLAHRDRAAVADHADPGRQDELRHYVGAEGRTAPKNL